MPQLRQYQEVTSTLPTDGIWLDRIGVGTVWTPVSDFAPGNGGIVVPPGSITLATNTFYGVRTSGGAYTLTLPALAAQAKPAYLEVADIDYNAAANNVTINAGVGDLVSYHGVTSGTYKITTSNLIVRFIANLTYWTVIPYGS